MRDGRDPLALLPLNLAAAGLATVLGALRAASQNAMPPIRDAAGAGPFLDNFFTIASNNLAAAAQVLLGVATFGVYAACILLWNAFRIGFDLVYVLRTSPQTLVYLSCFLFLEYACLCVMASIAESAGLSLLYYLFRGSSSAHLRRSLLLGSVSILVILVAAAIEAFLMSARSA